MVSCLEQEELRSRQVLRAVQPLQHHSHLFFSVGDRILIARLLTGQFPPRNVAYLTQTMSPPAA